MTLTETEWLNARTGKVTGSRIAGILGLSKYNTRDDVLREMVRQAFGDAPEFVGNIATNWGTEHEEDARAAYERKTGRLVLDAQDFVVHPDIPWLQVAPDGLIGTDGLLEIKCPPRARYMSVRECPHYEAQIQAQLACTGRAWADFVIWRSFSTADWLGCEPLIIERVPADRAWLPTHLPKLTEFHDEYERIIADPVLAEPYRSDLVTLLDDPESLLDETELAQILSAREALDEREQAVRARLTARAAQSPSKTVRGRWFQITKVRGSASVKYKDALAQLAPGADLTPFTAPAKESFRITRMKETE